MTSPLSPADLKALAVWDRGHYSCSHRGTCPSLPCQKDRNDLTSTVEGIVVRQVAEALAAERARLTDFADAKDREIAIINATPDPLLGRGSTMRAVIFTDELRALATGQDVTVPEPVDEFLHNCSWCESPSIGVVCRFSGTGEEDVPTCDACSHLGDDFVRYPA